MLYGFIAGVIGAAVGLGGAIILVPVWLKMGIDKDVATSSTGPLIFVSAFCSFFISAISGGYEMLEFLEYFALSFGSVLIVKSKHRVMQRSSTGWPADSNSRELCTFCS